ncbi:MAG: type III secretion system export apparatus subunit SctR [Kiritimatiellae bacterium]|jgi:type III secretion protein R|nr:type III secretion system export apparatus subunit SctR [Kiritimatiellia bacterium]
MFQTDPFALIALLVGLSLVAFVAMVATSYLKIVVVVSLVRNALGIQSIPPNTVVNALALILTFYIMAPVVGESWDNYHRYKEENVPAVEYNTDLALKSAEPFRQWLVRQTNDRERAFFVSTAERLWAKPDEETAKVDPESFHILIPSFCVSELSKAFQIGFLIYLPFIAIDIIVSNILLAMGMMMVSPVTISLPFKLLLFVMVNGWTLLIQGLIRGYI